MSNNCFTFVYDMLIVLGYQVPDKWGGFTIKDRKYFVEMPRAFLGSNLHFLFFDSFCDEVEQAQKDDIIITKSSVGLALNKSKMWVWSELINKPVIRQIKPHYKIMRVSNG